MIRAIESTEHIRDTVAILEEALEDARAGKLSSVLVFGELRGQAQLKTYKSGTPDRINLVGKLMHAIFELCCEPSK